MREKEKILEEIGFSKNEAKIYTTLLRLGLSTIGEITSKVGIHRRNVYDSLERLSEKGFVGTITKEKKKYFEATNPYYLLDVMENEKEKLKKKSTDVNIILSELLQLHKMSNERSSVIVYKGVKGIKSVLDDIVRKKEENLVLGAHKPPEPIRSYLERFHKNRIKLGIKDKMIFNRNDMERASRLSKSPLTEIRFMPKKYDSSTAVNVFGSTVAILTWSEPTAIIIKDKKIADTFREYFKILWKSAKKK